MNDEMAVDNMEGDFLCFVVVWGYIWLGSGLTSRYILRDPITPGELGGLYGGVGD